MLSGALGSFPFDARKTREISVDGEYAMDSFEKPVLCINKHGEDHRKKDRHRNRERES